MFRRGRRSNNGGDDFNANDLNIARLMSIGGIRIEWTSDMSEHLRLYGSGLEDDVSDETKETSDVSYRLSLYWFDARELTYIARDPDDILRDAQEIIRTWSFLFHGPRERRIHEAYRSLPLPDFGLRFFKEHYNFGLEDDILSSTDVPRDVEDAAYRRTMDFAFTHGLDQASGDIQIHLKQPLHK
ncbi:hypothetical protein TGAMA5MH_08839 [Trichoderma gamsii]|uniref:Uncharacterized protein n=1 Tax=Trichoderma gamsii TaxID=398673 RepID=A0A2K0T0W0_9HYPO|nr:hypothetical protein TGAMA5MH_08839 [Trichoderma gamsii]